VLHHPCRSHDQAKTSIGIITYGPRFDRQRPIIPLLIMYSPFPHLTEGMSVEENAYLPPFLQRPSILRPTSNILHFELNPRARAWQRLDGVQSFPKQLRSIDPITSFPIPVVSFHCQTQTNRGITSTRTDPTIITESNGLVLVEFEPLLPVTDVDRHIQPFGVCVVGRRPTPRIFRLKVRIQIRAVKVGFYRSFLGGNECNRVHAGASVVGSSWGG
jgi:hypothetical protein